MPALTLTYKGEVQLSLHPLAFEKTERQNAPISLTYVADSIPLTTTRRFFLQLLRAALQALPQYSTKVADVLTLVSSGWNIAQSIAKAERQLAIEGITDAKIMSDERICISATLLLAKSRTKLRVEFAVSAAVGDAFELSTSIETKLSVVYGTYKRSKLAVRGLEWAEAVRELRTAKAGR